MLFNSLDFAIFLPIVFAIYWSVNGRSLTLSNIVVTVSSYVFYGWWDWRFLGLIVLSTLIDYTIGRKLGQEEEPRSRKILLWMSLAANLGVLGFFKYFNFFQESFIDAFSLFGSQLSYSSLHIILPVGISFYTFQTLSYTIDVYRRQLEPTDDLIGFAAFVSFFPQLVAGPIERATNLLPQFGRVRNFSYPLAVIGMRQILWGLFKKMVIADNCAYFANEIFNNYDSYGASALFLGALFFAFQIYGDFSGYSDIAIGTARLFGFNLMQNFRVPYFSRDIAEFWRRWHISLSTWFRDYLYIPLGGSRGGTWLSVRNIFIIFALSGLWHGANWTFVTWGVLNAIYFLPLLLLNKNRTHTGPIAAGRYLPSLREGLMMLSTFLLTVLAWVFFRSLTVTDALYYLAGMADSSLLSSPNLPSFSKLVTTSVFILIMLLFEWIGRADGFGIETLFQGLNRWVRWGIYATFVLVIIEFNGAQQDFIYFQF